MVVVRNSEALVISADSAILQALERSGSISWRGSIDGMMVVMVWWVAGIRVSCKTRVGALGGAYWW